MSLDCCKILRLNVKSFLNRRCPLFCSDRPSVCSVAFCSGARLVCTRLAAHFSAVHSVCYCLCRRHRLLFKLQVIFNNYSTSVRWIGVGYNWLFTIYQKIPEISVGM